MKNFIFISPNFPANYWLFCRELKADGINVLGIGDQPYGELSEGLKESLSEYYKVDDLEKYIADADSVICGPMEANEKGDRLAFVWKDGAILELYQEA